MLGELVTCVEVGTIYGLAAVGIYLTFRTINFADLTCDGSFVMGGAISSVLIQQGFPPLIATVLAFLGGFLAGAFTGFLNVKLKISDLLSGIITAFMLYSINLRIMGNKPNMTLFDVGSLFSAQDCIVFVLIALLIVAYILASNLGLAMRSIGQSKIFPLTFGINISLLTVLGTSISNGFVATSGALFSQYQEYCDVSQGAGTLISGLASVVIGEKLFRFKKAYLDVFACLFGAIIYRLILTMSLHIEFLKLETQDLNLVTGVITIAFMILRRRKCSN